MSEIWWLSMLKNHFITIIITKFLYSEIKYAITSLNLDNGSDDEKPTKRSPSTKTKMEAIFGKAWQNDSLIRIKEKSAVPTNKCKK